MALGSAPKRQIELLGDRLPAPHEFGLNYEAERWKAIRFDAVKDYLVKAAA